MTGRGRKGRRKEASDESANDKGQKGCPGTCTSEEGKGREEKKKKNNGKKDTHTDGVCARGREERRKIEGMVQESERPIAMEEKRKIEETIQNRETNGKGGREGESIR